MKKIKGLLLKDILQTKSYFISNCLLCLLFCVLFVFQIFAFKNGGSVNGYNTGMPEETPNDLEILQSALFSSFFYFCIFPIYSCSGIALSFQQDERCNFDKFAISSGISRKLIVNERVIFGAIASIPGVIFTIVAAILVSMINNPYVSSLTGLYLALISFGGYFLTIGVSLTLCTFLGSVKGRIWTSLATILTVLLQTVAFVLYAAFGIEHILQGSIVAIGFFTISIAIFIGAYFLSLRAYLNKDF